MNFDNLFEERGYLNLFTIDIDKITELKSLLLDKK